MEALLVGAGICISDVSEGIGGELLRLADKGVERCEEGRVDKGVLL